MFQLASVWVVVPALLHPPMAGVHFHFTVPLLGTHVLISKLVLFAIAKVLGRPEKSVASILPQGVGVQVVTLISLQSKESKTPHSAKAINAKVS